MNQKKLEIYLNKYLGCSTAEDDALVYDLGRNCFLLLGSSLLTFAVDEETFDFDIEDILGVSLIDGCLNIDFKLEDYSDQTISINLNNPRDYFVSAKLSEAVFKIDVDNPSIKRLFVRAVDQGTAIKSVRSQYPGIIITDVSKFTESKMQEALSVDKDAIEEIFNAYSNPEIDRNIKLGIDWTMSNLFGSNWPSFL